MKRVGVKIDRLNQIKQYDLTDAILAFSLRDMGLSRSLGNILEIRRETDNQIEWFSINDINNGTLEAFCNGSQGFVKTWKNQNSTLDATQIVTTLQPQIVDSNGLLIKDNLGFPSIEFKDQQLEIDSFFEVDEKIISSFFVSSMITNEYYPFLFDTEPNQKTIGILYLGSLRKTRLATVREQAVPNQYTGSLGTSNGVTALNGEAITLGETNIRVDQFNRQFISNQLNDDSEITTPDANYDFKSANVKNIIGRRLNFPSHFKINEFAFVLNNVDKISIKNQINNYYNVF